MTTMEKAEAAYNALKVLAEHVGAREARRLLLKLRSGLDPVEEVLTGSEILYTEAEVEQLRREAFEQGSAFVWRIRA